ncbi:MAG: YesL family protein [Clostridia bacterium]|nr:YesL family protein [Clostridia bacterium]
MAGFFGLFNYEKEGPGIPKDAPQQKTFIVFFRIFKTNFWKFIPVSLVYIFLSLLLFTNGLANAGITNVCRNTARDKHSFGMSDFFETVKKNWKQSLIAGIINLLIYAVSGYSAWFYRTNFYANNNTFSLVGYGIILSVLLLFTFAQYYIWTMIITFDMKLKDIYKNSFKIAIANLWRNILVGILLLITYAIYAVIIIFVPYVAVWVLVGLMAVCTLPAYRFLMIQFVAFPAIKKYMIDPYYKEHPELDIEKRRSLGLIDE